MHYRYLNIDILCLIKNKNNPNFTVTDSPGFAPDSPFAERRKKACSIQLQLRRQHSAAQVRRRNTAFAQAHYIIFLTHVKFFIRFLSNNFIISIVILSIIRLSNNFEQSKFAFVQVFLFQKANIINQPSGIASAQTKRRPQNFLGGIETTMKSTCRHTARFSALILVLLTIAALFCGCSDAPDCVTTPPPASCSPVPTAVPTPVCSAPATADAAPDGKKVNKTLYYLTDEGYLLPVVASVPQQAGIAKACLAKMTASDENRAALSKNGLKAVIPQGTEIQISIQNGEARVNLVNLPVMPDYDSAQQLTEFDSVETVSIFLNGCNDITANGSLPPQKHGKYALNVENAEIATSGSAKPLTLYFPNESGSLMIPITRYAEGSTDLYSCIQQLAAGTELRGLRSCFPENTLVLGAVIENGILTVNLSSDFETVANDAGLLNLATQSVLLTALPYGSINEVHFAVNGIPLKID